ncbi:hypothetical protein TYRP_000818, partial [Tyrophagus putrescentiae]
MEESKSAAAGVVLSNLITNIPSSSSSSCTIASNPTTTAVLKVCQSLLYTLLCLQIVLISGIFFLSMNHSTTTNTSQVNSTPSLLALLLKLSTAPVCLLGIILVLAQATSLLTFLYLPLRLGFLFLLAKVYTVAATPGHFNAFQLVLLVESFTQALLLRYVMVLYKGGEGEGEGVQEQQQQQ